MSFLKSHGKKLLGLGYPIAPIKQGHKFPKGLANWQSIEADESLLNKWLCNGFSNGGVGVLARNTPAVDIDVHDEDIVNKMTAYVVDTVGATVERVGQAPKTLLVYRTDEPFNKVTSKTYIDFVEQEHRVEILGEGQQFVAYAVHPDTNKPYEWVSELTLSDIAQKDLPVLTVEDARDICRYFESIVPSDWVEKSSGNSGQVLPVAAVEDRALMNVKPKINVSTERLTKSLMSIKDADEYDTWVQIGMALYHQFDGGEEGFELWCDWSEQSEKFDADANEKKWSSFDADLRHQEPVTAATILDKSNKIKKEIKREEISNRGFTFTHGDSLFKVERPKYLIGGVIEKDTLCLIYGPSGCGKTFVVLDLVLSVASGKDWLGRTVEEGKVVVVAGEGRAGIKRRLSAWASRYFNREKLEKNVYLSDRVCLLPEDTDNFINALKGIPDLKVLVLDTLQRTSTGDENSATDMSDLIRSIDSIREAIHDLTIIVVHHSGHTKGRMRGSTVLRASADTELEVDKTDSGLVYLKHSKAKDSEAIEDVVFKLQSQVLDEWNLEEGEDPVSSAYLEYMPELKTEKNSNRKGPQGKHQRTALDVLKFLCTDSPNGVSIDNWCANCKDEGLLSKELHKPSKFLERITTPLERQGFISVENDSVIAK